MLLIYAKHLFSSNNRSEAVRVLVTYYAVQNKFAVVGQVKKSTIIPSKTRRVQFDGVRSKLRTCMYPNEMHLVLTGPS